MDQSLAPPVLDPTTWVDDYGDYLFRFALVRLRNPDTAEEVVQQTILAALTARHSFRGRSSERTWLTAILKRKISDTLRDAVRRNVREVSLTDLPTDSFFNRSGKWKKQPDEWSADDLGREINRAEFRTTVAECLGKLPDRLRIAFVLKHIDEVSTTEICQSVDVTANNLAVMLHRARLQMWRCLTLNWFGELPESVSEDRI